MRSDFSFAVIALVDLWILHCIKTKFSIKDFSSKCDQIRSKLRLWSHLLEKSLMENFISCAVLVGTLRLIHGFITQQKPSHNMLKSTSNYSLDLFYQVYIGWSSALSGERLSDELGLMSSSKRRSSKLTFFDKIVNELLPYYLQSCKECLFSR